MGTSLQEVEPGSPCNNWKTDGFKNILDCFNLKPSKKHMKVLQTSLPLHKYKADFPSENELSQGNLESGKPTPQSSTALLRVTRVLMSSAPKGSEHHMLQESHGSARPRNYSLFYWQIHEESRK
jgi:hypothetical protein